MKIVLLIKGAAKTPLVYNIEKLLPQGHPSLVCKDEDVVAVFSKPSVASSVLPIALQSKNICSIGIGDASIVEGEASGEGVEFATYDINEGAGPFARGSLAAINVENALVWLDDIVQSRSLRQQEVADLRRSGCTADNIASQLTISRRAVHKHLQAGKYSIETRCLGLIENLLSECITMNQERERQLATHLKR